MRAVPKMVLSIGYLAFHWSLTEDFFVGFFKRPECLDAMNQSVPAEGCIEAQ